MNDLFEIKIELPLQSPLKSPQKLSFLEDISDIIQENKGIVETTHDEYVEKRGLEILLILAASLGVSASILSIINSVLGISKKLGNDNANTQVFVKRKDGNYVKVDETMSVDDLKKQLEK